MTPRLPLLALPVLVLLATGCGDSAGPDEHGPVQLGVRITRVEAPQYGSTGDGIALISCAVSFKAHAGGQGTASWQGATVRFFAAGLQAPAFDSTVIDAAELSGAWGSSTIDGGTDQSSFGTLRATIPFRATITYRYSVAGISHTTEGGTATCRPPVPEGSAPPTINAVTVQPSTGPVGAGDVLTVNIGAASQDAGLWQIAVRLEGACDTVFYLPGGLAKNLAQTMHPTVTSTCALGSPLSLSVHVLDAALKSADVSPTTTLTVADHRGPVLSATGPLGGDYFIGDSLVYSLGANDDYGLAGVTWSVMPLGFVDSIPLSGLAGNSGVKLRITPSWGGAQQVRFWARDRAGNVSDTISSTVGAIRIHANVTKPVVLGTQGADDVVLDPARNRVFLLQSNDQRVAAMSLATGAFLWDILPGTTPLGIAPSSTGDSLLVRVGVLAQEPTPRPIGILDLTQDHPALQRHFLTLPDTLLRQEPLHVLPLPNNHVLVRMGGGWTQFLIWDITTGAEQWLDSAVTQQYGGQQVVASRDLATVLLQRTDGAVLRYNAATGAFSPLGSMARTAPDRVIPLDGGQTIQVGLTTYDQSFHVVRELTPTADMPPLPAIALSPDGQTLYALGSGLVRYRWSDGALLDRIVLPAHYESFRLSRDGNWAVAFNRFIGNFAIVDLR